MTKLWDTLQSEQLYAFKSRHIGPNESDIKDMLQSLSCDSLDHLIDTTVPDGIKQTKPLNLPSASSEHEALSELSEMMQKNKLHRSLIGMGYYDCITPPTIQRNILENPAWYTQYTPYQAEIAQGRLEALLNFQTMVCDLTKLDIANASLLDEGTAAAEAMLMAKQASKIKGASTYLVSKHCHPQTIAVVEARANAMDLNITLIETEADLDTEGAFGLLLQYPHSNGDVVDYSDIVKKAKAKGLIVAMACDLLALTLLKAPGELGADIAIGSSQRFGVPLGFGGPHAAFFATKDAHKRRLPGRLVGVSKDSTGKPAFRLTLQTREQHIRRDKATSNICTAQVLLAIMSSMYAVFHGPKGLIDIASRVAAGTSLLKAALTSFGYKLVNQNAFDTLTISLESKSEANSLMLKALDMGFNLRRYNEKSVSLSLDEKTTINELESICKIFSDKSFNLEAFGQSKDLAIPATLKRQSTFLDHEIFNRYHSETEMMRYMRKLEARDLSLTRSMIPLGSCTMKLNAASELLPITWPTVNSLHPFVPADQRQGYDQLFNDLENWLSEITGFDAISLQPNSGAQGEYAGLMVIAKYHEARGDHERKICLIPSSAHGTNPASAVLAGMKVVVVKCDDDGNIDLDDLKTKAAKYSDTLAALMITYPSTHGVFEASISEICQVIHGAGGQVYMDGANLNAQIGICRPGEYGPDVCHMNLHKTFCIPHGGGGPGMGPIGVKSHLANYLPSHPLVTCGGEDGIGPVSAAPWGSPSILPISWMYIRMMGAEGLTLASKIAILNANYVAKRLDEHYPVVYKGSGGFVAHECIIDLKPIKVSADITVDDIAKRLIDYGYHAPTVSWPVPNSMMIEPTESESKEELDRFCDTMISIRKEVSQIESGQFDRMNNPLKHAPHTADLLCDSSWDRPYSRNEAAFPKTWIKENKFWPHVSRIDNVYGDRNVVCSCPPLSEYMSQ